MATITPAAKTIPAKAVPTASAAKAQKVSNVVTLPFQKATPKCLVFGVDFSTPEGAKNLARTVYMTTATAKALGITDKTAAITVTVAAAAK